MKAMFKQGFKNMGYRWLMSDIAKNSFFLFEDEWLNQIRININITRIKCFVLFSCLVAHSTSSCCLQEN